MDYKSFIFIYIRNLYLRKKCELFFIILKINVYVVLHVSPKEYHKCKVKLYTNIYRQNNKWEKHAE